MWENQILFHLWCFELWILSSAEGMRIWVDILNKIYIFLVFIDNSSRLNEWYSCDFDEKYVIEKGRRIAELAQGITHLDYFNNTTKTSHNAHKHANKFMMRKKKRIIWCLSYCFRIGCEPLSLVFFSFVYIIIHRPEWECSFCFSLGLHG